MSNSDKIQYKYVDEDKYKSMDRSRYSQNVKSRKVDRESTNSENSEQSEFGYAKGRQRPSQNDRSDNNSGGYATGNRNTRPRRNDNRNSNSSGYGSGNKRRYDNNRNGRGQRNDWKSKRFQKEIKREPLPKYFGQELEEKRVLLDNAKKELNTYLNSGKYINTRVRENMEHKITGLESDLSKLEESSKNAFPPLKSRKNISVESAPAVIGLVSAWNTPLKFRQTVSKSEAKVEVSESTSTKIYNNDNQDCDDNFDEITDAY